MTAVGPAPARAGSPAEASPWASSGFRWYFAGTVTSWLGSTMAPVALAFAVLEISRSSTGLGLALAARSVPMVAFLVIGGALADRVSRSRLLRLANFGAGATQAAVAAVLLSGSRNLDVIVALELLNGTISAFTAPAMTGIVPQLVAADGRRRANSLLSSARSAIKIGGPVSAGIIVATVGGGWAIAFDAATFLFAAGCMSRLKLAERTGGTSSGLLVDIREGWTLFRTTRWVWLCSATMCVVNCLQVGVWSVLGPSVAVHTIGTAAWGLVLSASAAGLLTMSVVMYRLLTVHLLRFGHLCLALGAVPLIALGLGAGTPLLEAAAFLGGLGSAAVNVAWDTSLQTHVPSGALSRITAFDNLGAFLAVPIGQVAAGPLAGAAGTDTVAVCGGVLFAAMAVLPLLAVSVRDLRAE